MNLKKEIILLLEHITDENDLKNIYLELSNNKNILRTKYYEWVENQTEDVYNLHMQSILLEEYFDDMLLSKNSIMHKYLDTSCKKYSSNEDYFLLDANYYRLYISNDTNGLDGVFDKINRTITINKSCVHNKNILLHEMIHAHEQIINSTNSIIRDILIIELYNKFKKQIANLDELIFNHSYVPHNLELTEIGGEHSLLFFLKSIDLDLRCNNELFTIFSYDYNRNFKEIGLI